MKLPRSILAVAALAAFSAAIALSGAARTTPAARRRPSGWLKAMEQAAPQRSRSPGDENHSRLELNVPVGQKEGC